MRYKVIVIGVSAGGLNALKTILPCFDATFLIPVLIVQHVNRNSDDYLHTYLDSICAVTVMEAEDKMVPAPASVYIAPPNYHLLVEATGDLALALLPKVNYSRPSVDVLFESAAEAYLDGVIGVILTGANSDGAKGLARIESLGGLTVVQSPETAEAGVMPTSAIKQLAVDYILPLNEMGRFLNNLVV